MHGDGLRGQIGDLDHDIAAEAATANRAADVLSDQGIALRRDGGGKQLQRHIEDEIARALPVTEGVHVQLAALNGAGHVVQGQHGFRPNAVMVWAAFHRAYEQNRNT